MKVRINFWAFIFSFVCIALSFIAVSSPEIVHFVINLLHIHPLGVVLGITFITFIFALIGFSGATSWGLLLRSIVTTIITLGLCMIISFILIIGNLFRFT
jgi:hypothetical protein